MNQKVDNLNEIYTISKLLNCKNIKLSTWSNAMNFELIVLYTSNGDFIYYFFSSVDPKIKIIPWFKDPIHEPVSIDLSPTGSFLLILSQTCNLYILPIHSVFDANNKGNVLVKNNDITIHCFPFLSTTLKPTSLKLKSSNSSQNFSPNNSSLRNENEKNSYMNIGSSINSLGTENLFKVKDVLSSQNKVNPSVVSWWQITKNFQEVGIIGTMSGDIIFVDLITGIKVGELNVKNGIKTFKICSNNINDSTFLLLTLDNNEQYKLTLDPRNLNFLGQHSTPNLNDGNEDGHVAETSNVASDNLSYLPMARNRLQDLKEMSIEKFTSFKHKIAETRSKIGIRQGILEEVTPKICEDLPENLDSAMGSNLTLFHTLEKGNVVAGFHTQSQLLMVHSMNLDVVPLATYKMPSDTEEVILGDRIIYVINDKKTSLQVISSKLTETCAEQPCDFNYDSILIKFNFNTISQEKDNLSESVVINELENADTAQFSLHDSEEEGETILSCYKSYIQSEDDDICKIYKLNKTKDELPEFQKAENCIVITDKAVYFVYLKSNILKIVLDLILETYELEKAEKICAIFEISLQKVLELAADIKLCTLEFPTAMALYKLSKCGLLKSIVKLACGSHCSQVLNYSVILLSTSMSEMSLTERIHLSNLILMAYTQQILNNENCRTLMEKFMEFLKTNLYFDEVLAVSITGQSLLFTFLHKLITYKGLTIDGYNVLIKLMERFQHSRALDWSLNKKDFFLCITEPNLIEALIVKAFNFPTYFNYISQQVNDFDLLFLERILKLLDPTSLHIRPIALLFKDGNSLDSDDSQAAFNFGKLVELFLVILMVKLQKTKKLHENYEKKFLLPFKDCDSFCDTKVNKERSSEFDENLNDVNIEKIKKRSNCFLSCGFAHTAFIRNGSLYTWGQTLKGCLGQGPSMARYSSPGPVSSLNSLKLEVFLVACGKHHTAVLTNNGVYTWGCSKYGQLGLGENIFQSPYPRLVAALANETVTGLACGQFHTLAMTSQGSVFAWGWGVHGQLGIGSTDDQKLPKLIEALTEHKIVDIAAGHGHSLVLSDKGHVYSFGSSIFGQLGTGTTTKYSVPVFIKGIDKKVVTISTGYFHSLALTESNVLYTWGSSPQCLRFQAQGRKKLRLQQNQNSSKPASNSEPSKNTAEKFVQKSPEKTTLRNENEFKNEEETHLAPTIVDTSNVSGKITQISCGCHHSALITDSGDVYTWGRSLDGQLGNGGHREIPIPTQISPNSLKADRISCGCEFTTALEKNTGKIFSWGSNALGQLANPIRESATKSLDGKLVMLKSCKRIVRLLDRNPALNSIDTPKEMPDVPPPSYTYQIYPKSIIPYRPTLSSLDPDYTEWSLHYVIENFRHWIDLNFILSKSWEYNNFQATSKISLLQNCEQSVTYQLKALQNTSKYQKLRSVFYQKNKQNLSMTEPLSHESEPPSSESKFENKQIETTGESPQIFDSNSDQNETKELHNEPINLHQNDDNLALSEEYMENAKYILETYFNLNSDEKYKGISKSYIIESGIQFWTAEKCPFDSLETLFLNRLNEIFYDLGLLLFCPHQKSGQSQYFQNFSTLFLCKVTTQILSLIDRNKDLDDYIISISKRLENEEINQKVNTRTEKQTAATLLKSKPKYLLDAIKEYLMEKRFNENYIRISYGQMMNDKNYFFSCGHHHSSDTLKEDFKIFDDISDECFKLRLTKMYENMEDTKQVELSCPSCLGNYLKPLLSYK